MLSTIEKFLTLMHQAKKSNELNGSIVSLLAPIVSYQVAHNDTHSGTYDELRLDADNEIYDEVQDLFTFMSDNENKVAITYGVTEDSAELATLRLVETSDAEIGSISQIFIDIGSNSGLICQSITDSPEQDDHLSSFSRSAVLPVSPKFALLFSKMNDSINVNELLALTCQFFTTRHGSFSSLISDYISLIKSNMTGVCEDGRELMSRIVNNSYANVDGVLAVIVEFYKGLTSAKVDDDVITFTANWAVTSTSVTGVIIKTLAAIAQVVGQIVLLFGGLISKVVGAVISVAGAVINRFAQFVSDSTHYNVDDDSGLLDYTNPVFILNMTKKTYDSGTITWSVDTIQFSSDSANASTHRSLIAEANWDQYDALVADYGLVRINFDFVSMNVLKTSSYDQENHVLNEVISVCFNQQLGVCDLAELLYNVVSDLPYSMGSYHPYGTAKFYPKLFINHGFALPGTSAFNPESLKYTSKSNNRDKTINELLYCSGLLCLLATQSTTSLEDFEFSFGSFSAGSLNSGLDGLFTFLAECMHWYQYSSWNAFIDDWNVFTACVSGYFDGEYRVSGVNITTYPLWSRTWGYTQFSNAVADGWINFSKQLIGMHTNGHGGLFANSEFWSSWEKLPCNQYPGRFINPPAIEKGALIKAFIIDAVVLAAVTLVTIAATVGISKVRARHQALNTAKAEKAWDELKQNPTKANYEKYRLAVKHNNLTSFLTGGSTISRGNYWASGDSRTGSALTAQNVNDIASMLGFSDSKDLTSEVATYYDLSSADPVDLSTIVNLIAGFRS